MKAITTLITSIALQVLLTMPSSARGKGIVTYDKLVAKADLVAIIEPIANEETKDPYVGLLYGFTQKDFVATNTKFRVHAYLKGGDAAAKEITILHFSYSKSVGGRANGACFITFVTGPLQYEKRALKDDKPVGGVSVYKQQPIWLAFLKKRSDGRFDPISDPYDSADSFREIHNSSFYTVP
jgi:hypothetical protein